MEHSRFDQFALLLAAARSRREALRLLAAGVVSAVAVARSPRPAAAALCPDRVPKPGYTPTANGCGPEGYDWVVPDNWKKANFTPACNRHDICYGTCNSSRMTCDFLIRRHLRQACERAYGDREDRKLRRRCYKRANTYFNAVRNHGQSAYEDAQNEACECCEPGAACGNRCCVTGSTCCGGAICCATGTCCGSSCCPTEFCYECVGGSCRSKCGHCQWCNRGVCEDCGIGCCGG